MDYGLDSSECSWLAPRILRANETRRLVLKKWILAKASRTWVAHGLVSLTGAVASALVANAWKLAPFMHGFIYGASCMLGYFIVRELKDKAGYIKAGTWNTSDPKWRDGVSPAADMAGDLMGPFFVWLTATAIFLLPKFGIRGF